MNLVDLPEHRRNPGEILIPAFTRRLPHDSTTTYSYPPDLPAEGGLEVSQPPIYPENPGSI
jgi:hypothetical protein